MKTIAVIGSRKFIDYKFVEYILDAVWFLIGDFQVVSGGAEGGDLMGLKWSHIRKFPPVLIFPAYWDDLSNSDAVIKTDKKGRKYDALAGFRRNQQIVDNTNTAVIAFMNINAPTNGTADTIQKAVAKNIPVYIFYPGNEVMLIGENVIGFDGIKTELDFNPKMWYNNK